MEDLVIVCEDSFGLDVMLIAQRMNEFWVSEYQYQPFAIKGYIVPEHCTYRTEIMPFLGTIETKKREKNEVYAMGIVNPSHKAVYVRILKSIGARFALLWAPWVLAPLTMKFGEGCIIAAHSIKETAKIGNFVTLFHSMLDDGAIVGDYSSVMAYTNLTTSELEEEVYIGPNCAVMEKVKVGVGSCVTPNSVVVRNVKKWTTVQGVPAKKVIEKG